MTGTLICDEDGLDDPRQFNDRLLLGVKGQMSEAELYFIKARLRGGVLSEAGRGELIQPLPVGLAYDAAGHVVLDPDTAVQHALRHLFDTFAATGSATACVKAFREADLSFPARHQTGPARASWTGDHCSITPRCGCCTIPATPARSPAFDYVRYHNQKQPNVKWSCTLLPREEWISFIPNAHPGYITLEAFDANHSRLADAAAAHGRDRAGGPSREGSALLQGIIICGRCGKRMTVRYHRRRGQASSTYVCQRDGIANAQPICAAIPCADPDKRIGQVLLETLSPLAVEAALTVSAELQQRSAEADQIRAAHVERARYQADLARRRYMAVAPPTGW